MEKLNKENAKKDFYELIKKSWTYARLTKKEKENLQEAFDLAVICGNYRQRWEGFTSLYNSFLLALDYKPIGWRGD